jgi:hypothetical protein
MRWSVPDGTDGGTGAVSAGCGQPPGGPDGLDEKGERLEVDGTGEQARERRGEAMGAELGGDERGLGRERRDRGQGEEVGRGVGPARGAAPGREVGEVDCVVIVVAGRAALVPVVPRLGALVTGDIALVVVVMPAVVVMAVPVVVAVCGRGERQVVEVNVGGPAAGMTAVGTRWPMTVVQQPLGQE